MKTVKNTKKTYTVHEYTAIVNKIITSKKPIDEQLVEMLETFGGCKVISLKEK
jgi:hypothetical protein